ncbi:hypothetical protein ACHAXR_005371, partial [Thalassiosira sp. AJA248-18]
MLSSFTRGSSRGSSKGSTATTATAAAGGSGSGSNHGTTTPRHHPAPPPQPPDTPNTAHQRSQHRSLITIVHTKTLTLARTVTKYPRKHRDLTGVLGDAVEALEEFRDVEWPPRRAEMEDILESVPSWLGGGGSDDDDDESNGGVVEREEDVKMTKLAQEMERKAVVASEQSSLSASENDVEGGSSVSSSHGKNNAAAVNAALGKELEETNVNDEEEAEKLHQEVLHAGEDNASKTEDEGNEKNVGSGSEDGHNDDDDKEKPVQENGETKPTTEESSSYDEEEKHESIAQKEKPMETPQSPVPPSGNNKKSNSTKSKSNDNVVVDADAAAMEPMHPAVITTLHALCMVISSESKTPKMAELALECITILTNGRYVSGVAGGRMKLMEQRRLSDSTPTKNNKPAGGEQQQQQQQQAGHDGRDGGLSFLGYVVESITRASESPSESVQGGMAKALLAIMTCPKCGVHEAAMLQAVRSTFHVYLVGKSASGKELAKRTLVDMLKCVFNRMEAYDIVSKDSSGGGGDGEGGNGEKVVTIASSKSGEDDGTVGTATTTATTTNGGSVDDPSTSAGMFASQYHTDSYLLFRALCKLSSKTLPGDENVGPVPTTPTATTLGFQSVGGSGGMIGGSGFFSTTPTVDPLALNSKTLSLELILAVFEHCGDAFRYGEKFVHAVQSYLCVSLLKNCMSNQTVVAHLSLKIFLLLVRKFKTHLKAEIEVFVANIFLRVLESPNSPFEQKVLVLEALRALCADPQMLTQLFLNYDCDFDAVNLYKDIVHHVTRISAKACAPKSMSAGVNGSATKKSVDQELDLSRTGLEVLVVILRSFLQSLGLPGGDDVFDESDGSSTLAQLRQTLKIDIRLDATDNNAADKQASSNKSSDVSLDQADSSSDNNQLDHIPNHRESESSEVAGKIVDAFDKKRTAQQNFEIGRVKFTLSLKGGLNFFIDSGFCQLDAKDMARFLYENSETLDKTQIGEVLGKEIDAPFVKGDNIDAEKGGSGFFLRVLSHYVDMMEFTDKPFDDSIRL